VAQQNGSVLPSAKDSQHRKGQLRGNIGVYFDGRLLHGWAEVTLPSRDFGSSAKCVSMQKAYRKWLREISDKEPR
jgi:hypothetical protein